MEKRNGVWTSKARSDDARDIARLARELIATADDDRVVEIAKNIERKARDLEADL